MNVMIFKNYFGWEGDKRNQHKNREKHTVSAGECEQVFFNKPFLLYEDVKHSKQEKRWYALGKTDANRKLFISFTIRNKLIRIISTRDANRKEKLIYEDA